MSRPSNRRSIFWAAWLIALAIAQPLCADEVADYLDQLGLRKLLAAHLEAQIETVAPDDRAELTTRLAAIYAELLESADDEAQRADLEARGRKLLATAPAASVDELRLALLRASYRSAERVAEQHRLRLSTPQEVDAARKTLGELVNDLAGIRQQLHDKLESTERRLSRAIGAEAITLAQFAERLRSLYAQATFLQAWSIYYQAWLAGTGERSRPSEPLFAELMGTESTTPLPEDISVDLRANESVARSILGMALSKSISSSVSTAIAWIELLDDPNAFEPLRSQAPVWKMSVLLENGDFVQVRTMLDEHRAAGEVIPLPWLRLVVVNAIEQAGANRNAADLAKAIVLELAQRGELDQILDLAQRYGVDALGESGFALQYVKGVLAYQDARKAHGSEEPTLDAALQSKYENASVLLQQALTESDAQDHSAAQESCRRFIAWSEYFKSDYLKARISFDALATSTDQDAAADAQWMAIVCLDRLASSPQATDELKASLGSAIDRFLAMYPGNEHAAELVLKRTLSDPEVSLKAVNDLLAIPSGSSVYVSAQGRAADLLYRLFRQASSRDRPDLAAQFLNVEAGLIDSAAMTASPGDAAEVQSTLGRCRRALEVALSDDVNNCATAARVFRVLDDPDRIPPAALLEFRSELQYRRLQERLCAGDAAAAERLADQAWMEEETSTWANLAARAVFRYGQRMMREDDASPAMRTQALELVAKHGGRVLREYAGNPAALEQSNALAFHAAVAEASLQLWQATGDAERGKAALYLYDILVNAKPQNRAFLVAAATLNERLGSKDKALDFWRRVVSGTPPNTESWFEAKFRMLSLLNSMDAARARQVMDQHKAIYPDYGPEPWGAKLRGLDEQIPAAIAPPASAPAENAESAKGGA